MATDMPLIAVLAGGELRIRIGVDTLAFATEHGPLVEYNEDTGEYDHPRVTNAKKWAEEVLNVLYEEVDETGQTRVGRLLDEACQKAIEDGAEGIVGPWLGDEYTHYEPTN